MLASLILLFITFYSFILYRSSPMIYLNPMISIDFSMILLIFNLMPNSSYKIHDNLYNLHIHDNLYNLHIYDNLYNLHIHDNLYNLYNVRDDRIIVNYKLNIDIKIYRMSEND